MTHTVVKKESWDKVLTQLQNVIGEQNYLLYLKNTIVVQLTQDLIEIGVPNLTIADFVQARFADAILDSAKNALGFRPRQIKFSINGHLFRRLRDRANQGEGQKPAPQSQSKQEAQGAPQGTKKRSNTTTRRRKSSQIFHLNPRYRLDNFVVGANNKLAFNAAVDITKRPGEKYNPLFIYGGCGLGKTHLLQGIANKLVEQVENLRTLYVSAEYFVNQYVQALGTNSIETFRNQFRNVDVLIVDDLHFLRGKEKSQEELLHTLSALENQGKQIVLASDLHPKELSDFRESLLSRFVQGMVAELSAPPYETRLALIKSKIAPFRELFPDSVVNFLAEKLECNIRELEGYLNQLQALANVMREELSLGLVQQALSDFLARRHRLVELSDIENLVIAHYGVTSEQLHSRVRKRNIALARQVCMYLARNLTQYSLKEIGRFFGNKNHTTVVFAEQKISQSLEKDSELKATLTHLTRQLKTE